MLRMSAMSDLIWSRVVVGAGHTPEFFAGGGVAVEEVLGCLIVVGEESGVEQAERDADGSGERGRVDQVRGAEGLCVVQAVGEHQAAFGVGVHDLDRLAAHGGNDVAGLERFTVRHGLAGADDGKHAHVRLELVRWRAWLRSWRPSRPCTYFILSMFSAGLMEMPPVSKVMPLPTRPITGSVRRGFGWGLVAHDDERRCARASLA